MRRSLSIPLVLARLFVATSLERASAQAVPTYTGTPGVPVDQNNGKYAFPLSGAFANEARAIEVAFTVKWVKKNMNVGNNGEVDGDNIIEIVKDNQNQIVPAPAGKQNGLVRPPAEPAKGSYNGSKNEVFNTSDYYYYMKITIVLPNGDIVKVIKDKNNQIWQPIVKTSDGGNG